MNCEKYQQLLSQFVDDDLNKADCSVVGDHLLTCDTCYHIYLELSVIVFRCRGLKSRDDGTNREAALAQ